MIIQESCQKLLQYLKDNFQWTMEPSDLQYLCKSDFLKNWIQQNTGDDKLNDLARDIYHSASRGMPIQYVISEGVFLNLVLKVDSSVLIPRPETEELVSWIMEDNKQLSMEGLTVLDIGTGSGCIALAIKKQFDTWKVTGLDVSNKALSVAKMNAQLCQIDVDFLEQDFLDKSSWVDVKYNIIVSNPPYISKREYHLMNSNVLTYEPHLALFPSGEDELIFYKFLAEFGKAHLEVNGKMYCELNEFKADDIANIFLNEGYVVKIKNDLEGKPRMLRSFLN